MMLTKVLNRALSRFEILLLIGLLFFEHQYLAGATRSSRGGWFYVTGTQLQGKLGISQPTIAHARQSLKLKGLIEYVSGYKGRATEYRIKHGELRK